MNRVTNFARIHHPFQELDKMYQYAREHIMDYEYQVICPGAIAVYLGDPWAFPVPKDGRFHDWDRVLDISKWINLNIAIKIDTNNEATDRVLLRIATGMIEKLNWSKDAKIEAHLNLLNNWRRVKQEWQAFKVMKSELPNSVPF